MFHLKLKDTLKHSIATVTSHMDSFVYNPGRDYSRIRKLSPDHVISFLISQGASSTKCEFLDFFQMSEDLPSISALNQRRSQMMPEALEAVFHEFTSSSEKLELSKQEQQYQYIAADGSTTSFFSFSKYSSDDYFISEGHSASGFYSIHINTVFPKQYHQLVVYHFFKQMKICLFVVGKTNKNLTIFIFHKFFKAFLFKCQVISGICFIYLNTIEL